MSQDISLLHTRIAPTPSGFLHAGNGISFIITWAIARAFNGNILLRIDDLDAQRMRQEYVEDIFLTLDWLGLDYDRGPTSPDDFFQNFSQHKRFYLYAKAIDKLLYSGLLYECRCSRKDIRLHSDNNLYPNTCRGHQLGARAEYKDETAWRIKVEHPTLVTFKDWQKGTVSILLDEVMGDFVMRQKNGLPSYQIASLVDDQYFDINFIVRGTDLLHSTAAQIFLAQYIGYPHFAEAVFFHHPLMIDTEGGKLSKSEGAVALKEWRHLKRSPIELYQKAAIWLNLPSDTIKSITHIEDLVCPLPRVSNQI